MLGERGSLDMGVPDHYTVAEAKRNRRRRNHRVVILNQIEEELSKSGGYQDEDIVLWKHAEGKYMGNFSTRRLQTTDRMQIWNTSINTTCVLCNSTPESCAHLFFDCSYTRKIWRSLVGGLMQDSFTTDWSNLIALVSKPWLTPIKTFVLRYTLQAAVHAIWWERNARRHGEKPKDTYALIMFVDKGVRLKLLSVKEKGKHFNEGLTTWFGTRLNT
ncbi:uncharacterized protein LOC130498096 [Raphanus sativus]|uniref:Uncharacterized protein LOC130498096 n=1 Tax=Raphanus sativus TaxID=3726 RepID=A0A9W3C7C3_RAPSA|nr:uncharacterized protein LOC130498096 [Raphanus sativus]